MSNYTLYQKPSGRIEGYGDYPQYIAELQVSNSRGVVSGTFDGVTHYVDTSTETAIPRLPLSLVANKATIIADGLDEWIVTGIPEGALVTDPTGVTSTVNDGEIVFSVDIPDTYVFIIKAFPYLDTEISIEATA